MDSAPISKPRIREVLACLAEKGKTFHCEAPGLVVVDNLVHLESCPEAPSGTEWELFVSHLLTTETGLCCLPDVPSLPGMVRRRVGSMVLQHTSNLLAGEAALRAAPEATDLSSALELLTAESYRVEAHVRAVSERALEVDPFLRLVHDEVMGDEDLNSKVAAADAIVRGDEGGLLDLLAERIGIPTYPSTDWVVTQSHYGWAPWAITCTDDPLVRASFVHYVADDDKVFVVPGMVLDAWYVVGDDLVTSGAYTGLVTLEGDPRLVETLRCLVRDEPQARFADGHLARLVELAATLR